MKLSPCFSSVAKLLAVGVLAASGLLPGPVLAGETEPRLVTAHYMHCYVLGGLVDNEKNRGPVRQGVEEFDHWPEKEILERNWWSARLTPLATAGPKGVEEDFALAHRAGIDAFGLLISQKHLPDSVYAPIMAMVAEQAAKDSIKIYPDLWDSLDLKTVTHADLTRYGQVVKDFMDAHPTAFLKRGGKPVIALGNPVNGRSDDKAFLWEDYRAFFEPWGGPEHCYIILNANWQLKKVGETWYPAVDAFSMWCASQGWGDPYNATVAQLAHKYHKEIDWPVNSDYFGGRRGCESMAEGLGAARFCDQWRKAITEHAGLVALETWNDFSEGHSLTETNYRGDTFIELNRFFADWFHTNRMPAVATEKVFLFHQRQLVHAKLTESTHVAHNDSYHPTPTVDYIDVVTLLKAPARVTLLIGDRRWTNETPAGCYEWLVYVPSERTERGPEREAFTMPNGSSYPHKSVERTVTVCDRIPEGTPSVVVERQNQPVGALTSRAPLAAEARWQDLTVVGTSTSLPAETKDARP